MNGDPTSNSRSIFDHMLDPAWIPQEPGSLAGPLIGTPDLDVLEWDGKQSYPEDCAIRSQQFIIEQFTGTKIDETALMLDAESHGWFDPQTGTSPQDVGNELESHGIPVNRYEHANLYTLANELGQGHKVIIGVDAGELWSGTPDGRADHAVVVSGIDATDPQNPQVIVSDPGTGEAEHRYPLDQFVRAWQSSDFFMVATQQAPPSTAQGMAHFDYSAGHIPQIADIPYEQFVMLRDHPGAVNALFDSATTGEPQLSPQSIFHDANPDVYPTPNLDTSPIGIDSGHHMDQIDTHTGHIGDHEPAWDPGHDDGSHHFTDDHVVTPDHDAPEHHGW